MLFWLSDFFVNFLILMDDILIYLFDRADHLIEILGGAKVMGHIKILFFYLYKIKIFV
jgi:hypothetical protein